MGFNTGPAQAPNTTPATAPVALARVLSNIAAPQTPSASTWGGGSPVTPSQSAMTAPVAQMHSQPVAPPPPPVAMPVPQTPASYAGSMPTAQNVPLPPFMSGSNNNFRLIDSLGPVRPNPFPLHAPYFYNKSLNYSFRDQIRNGMNNGLPVQSSPSPAIMAPRVPQIAPRPTMAPRFFTTGSL